jgi:hypothetical protein
MKHHCTASNVLGHLGQNLIEIHIESALISDDGLRFLRRLGLDKEDASKMTSFVFYDFFEFETQVSPLGLSQKPKFNFTSKFKVYTDDFFLQYLQTQSSTIRFCLSNGLEFIPVATCAMVMKELTDPERTDRLRYYADLVSIHDGRTLIGKIDFGLRARLPMAQAIRAFKERSIALNLLTVSDDETSSRRFRSRADTNDLVVRLIQCRNLRGPPGEKAPTVFASFQFYIHDDIVTDTIRNSINPLFNFLRIIPLPMTSDLDRYLRTANLRVYVIDDNSSPSGVDHVYGFCTIPLLPLALGESIEGSFDVKDEFGLGRSQLDLSISWSKPYKLGITPIVSQLDNQYKTVPKSNEKRSKSPAPPRTRDINLIERASSGSSESERYLGSSSSNELLSERSEEQR